MTVRVMIAFLISGFLSPSSADVLGDLQGISRLATQFGFPGFLCPKEMSARKQPNSGGLEEMFRVSCQWAESDPPLSPREFQKKMKERGWDRLVESLSPEKGGVKRFQQNLYFFVRENRRVAERMKAPPNQTWKLNVTETPACKYAPKAGTNELIQEVRFDESRFLGMKHFYKLDPEQLKQAQKDLEKRAFSGMTDAVIIEGREAGEPLDCAGVLRDAFTKREDMKSESTFLIQRAFFKQAAIIPGDNQYPSAADLAAFPPEQYPGLYGEGATLASLQKDAIFMSILNRYASPDSAGLEAEIETVCRNRGVDPCVTSEWFETRYKELNGRPLPKDATTLAQDVRPIAGSTPGGSLQGTNRLKDRLDLMRNQSLLSAIQTGRELYRRPVTVYGSGHLSDVGSELEQHSKKVTNIDLKSDPACK